MVIFKTTNAILSLPISPPPKPQALQWSPVSFRVRSKLLSMAFKDVQDLASGYHFCIIPQQLLYAHRLHSITSNYLNYLTAFLQSTWQKLLPLSEIPWPFHPGLINSQLSTREFALCCSFGVKQDAIHINVFKKKYAVFLEEYTGTGNICVLWERELWNWG